MSSVSSFHIASSEVTLLTSFRGCEAVSRCDDDCSENIRFAQEICLKTERQKQTSFSFIYALNCVSNQKLTKTRYKVRLLESFCSSECLTSSINNFKERRHKLYVCSHICTRSHIVNPT